MKSTYLTNLLLLVVAVLLVWLMTETNTSSSVITISDSIDPTQVTEIEIQRREQQTIQLQQDQQWQLVQPVKARANQTRIKLLLSLLEQPVQTPILVTDNTDLAEFGLAQPNLTLLFNQQKFAFGDTESLSGQRYIQHNQQIYLIHDDISPLLGASASSFVDNRLLDPISQIQSIQLPALHDDNAQSQTSALSIYQQDNNWLASPDNYNQDQLITLIQNWQQAYAMQVVINADIDLADDKPVVLIELADNTQRKFVVSHNNDSLTLTDPQLQLQYQFPAQIINALFSIND
ncbi:DUF4340 domain-containing protein [Methylophaga sp. SB9B]|uniref:DUF4340 domain-containing protein n=1 Tax=Methylophaga sp. SB9B TaxID=2570356 RepID=UPI00145628CB|nr:DUF4340 domain-containing protein [Methylophaga sp. SB9B]